MVLHCAITQLRRRINLSQQRFSHHLGISISGLVNYENDRRTPSRELLAALFYLASGEGYDDLANAFQRALAESLSPGEAIDEKIHACETIHRPSSKDGALWHALIWATGDSAEAGLFDVLIQVRKMANSEDAAVSKKAKTALEKVHRAFAQLVEETEERASQRKSRKEQLHVHQRRV